MFSKARELSKTLTKSNTCTHMCVLCCFFLLLFNIHTRSRRARIETGDWRDECRVFESANCACWLLLPLCSSILGRRRDNDERCRTAPLFPRNWTDDADSDTPRTLIYTDTFALALASRTPARAKQNASAYSVDVSRQTAARNMSGDATDQRSSAFFVSN